MPYLKSKKAAGLLILLAVIIAMGLLAQYALYHSDAADFRLPTQAQWSGSLGTPSGKTLLGTLVSVRGDSIVIVAQQPVLGSTSVAIGSSTRIIRYISLSPDELVAAYKEFLRLQKEADGKPFDAPSTHKVAILARADLRAGDTVLVTLTASSTKDAFATESIEVMPVFVGGNGSNVPAATQAPPVPPIQ